jgi:hypothetical protein
MARREGLSCCKKQSQELKHKIKDRNPWELEKRRTNARMALLAQEEAPCSDDDGNHDTYDPHAILIKEEQHRQFLQDIQAQITVIYKKHDPSKVAKLPKLIARCEGKEITLLNAIKKRFQVDDEWLDKQSAKSRAPVLHPMAPNKRRTRSQVGWGKGWRLNHIKHGTEQVDPKEDFTDSDSDGSGGSDDDDDSMRVAVAAVKRKLKQSQANPGDTADSDSDSYYSYSDSDSDSEPPKSFMQELKEKYQKIVLRLEDKHAHASAAKWARFIAQQATVIQTSFRRHQQRHTINKIVCVRMFRYVCVDLLCVLLYPHAQASDTSIMNCWVIDAIHMLARL